MARAKIRALALVSLGAIALGACIVSIAAVSASAREPARPQIRFEQTRGDQVELAEPGMRGQYEVAAVDTYCIAWYDFEVRDWQGWTRVDETAQPGTFFHVDDFDGLGGGSFGLLVPIEGTKSMWCGVRPNPEDFDYVCRFRKAPGYGNMWRQYLVTEALSFSGALTFSYHLVYDSEPDYDFTYVEYDRGGGRWETIAGYHGEGDTVASHFLPITQARTKLRFRFHSDGAWSDEDGLWNTDGACIVDSIVVRDGGVLDDFQDFETVPVGAQVAGIWRAEPEPGFGRYSGFWQGLTDPDPCNDNLGTQVVFFVGSPNPSTSIPGIWDTPFCAGPGGIEAPCQDESVQSPPIDMTKYSTGCNSVQDADIPPGDLPQLGGCYLRFTIYRDLPLPNLVFYQWEVRKIVGGCPRDWQDYGFVHYGADRNYFFSSNDISAFAGNEPLQVRLGVKDMCAIWYLMSGNCAQHTPSPWFDNVRIYRFKTSGPQWGWRDIDLFQDNFPEDEFDLESWVRADAAKDILPRNNPNIRPGDSIVVTCSSPIGGGIASDPAGGPAMYLHVKCTYVGAPPAKPNLAGPTLAGSVMLDDDPPAWKSFNYIGDDGVWTKIQCDSARIHGNIVQDRYMVDLADGLFTRGYMIEYYFTARDNAGIEAALPRYARSGPPYFEWTCLPTLRSDVLFVDDFTGRGSFAGSAEDFWMPVFDAVLVPPNNEVDTYDVNGPTSGVSNGLGSRATLEPLVDTYRTIVWDCGDLGEITISDGVSEDDKSNDCQMLIDWMNLSEHPVGLWICGDNAAADLDALGSPQAIMLMSSWCGVDFVDDSYYELTGGRIGGGVVNPLLGGNAEGIFVHAGVPDRFHIFGGCPTINAFDVLEKTAGGSYALDYPAYQGTTHHAGIQSAVTNAGGFDARTMWFGFSYQYVRDDAAGAPIDRFEIARDVFQYLNGATNPDITRTETPGAYRLSQNYPNPFNPVTTIRYDMREKGLVRIRVYDVSGRLVRTLVDGVKDAGSWAEVWNGTNDLGADAASGIYFCKMETAHFSATRKLVLLR